MFHGMATKLLIGELEYLPVVRFSNFSKKVNRQCEYKESLMRICFFKDDQHNRNCQEWNQLYPEIKPQVVIELPVYNTGESQDYRRYEKHTFNSWVHIFTHQANEQAHETDSHGKSIPDQCKIIRMQVIIR